MSKIKIITLAYFDIAKIRIHQPHNDLSPAIASFIFCNI